MGKIFCLIWESCKNQATSACFNCEDNEFAEEPIEECYEFNNWDDDENNWNND